MKLVKNMNIVNIHILYQIFLNFIFKSYLK